MSGEVWTDARIREAFMDDGGQAEYYDPINGHKEQRRWAGEVFDNWLKEHDTRVAEDAYEDGYLEGARYGYEG